jgi:hypothetical protein
MLLLLATHFFGSAGLTVSVSVSATPAFTPYTSQGHGVVKVRQGGPTTAKNAVAVRTLTVVSGHPSFAVPSTNGQGKAVAQ